jgi:hypothetical protein
MRNSVIKNQRRGELINEAREWLDEAAMFFDDYNIHVYRS